MRKPPLYHVMPSSCCMMHTCIGTYPPMARRLRERRVKYGARAVDCVKFRQADADAVCGAVYAAWCDAYAGTTKQRG